MSFISYSNPNGTHRVHPRTITFEEHFEERRAPTPPPVPLAVPAGLSPQLTAMVLLDVLHEADPALVAGDGITRRGRRISFRAWCRYVWARALAVDKGGAISHVPCRVLEHAYYRGTP
jgi:hypothetical protein